LDLLVEAVTLAGYIGHIDFAMDPASSEFYRKGSYDLGIKDKSPKALTPAELASLYGDLIGKYPLVLLEDPFAEDGWTSWSTFMERGTKVEIVGVILTFTNVERVEMAVQKKACDGLLLKINQIGTISEAIAA
jgi:enolase